ncbi:MAG: serine/threonine protein kinase, partial [Cyanobacteria bacterium]|nr:serine/threonine protein kinase [Cyanobacteriota bacterium]
PVVESPVRNVADKQQDHSPEVLSVANDLYPAEPPSLVSHPLDPVASDNDVLMRCQPPMTAEVLLEYGHQAKDLQRLRLTMTRRDRFSQALALTISSSMLIAVVGKVGVDLFYAAFTVFFVWLFPLIGLPSTGTFVDSGASAASVSLVIALIYTFSVVFALLTVNKGGISQVFQPTHIGVSLKGLRRVWSFYHLEYFGKLMPWSLLTDLSLQRSKKDRVPKLAFTFRGKKRLRINMLHFRHSQELTVLRQAIDAYSPLHVRNPSLKLEIIEAMPTETRYTEIWTEALLSQPKRQWLTQLPPGTKLCEDKYEIVAKIGSGGQGTVYRANQIDRPNEPDVVLKEYILPEQGEANDRRRALKSFEQEVHLLNRINHDKIVALYDVFIQDHRAYLVIEHVDGPSLKQIVESRGPVDQNKVAEMGLEMCEILDCLHTLQPPLVHQDFTPDNLLTTRDGSIKLVDFNVTREDLQLKTALVVGKQSYMPPEQFKGKACPQSDIYALGATLFFLITGKEPEALSRLHPRKDNQEIDEKLDFIVGKSTALDLQDRYRNVEELRTDLRQLQIKLLSCDYAAEELEKQGAEV